jgi:ankyrin repeat protein
MNLLHWTSREATNVHEQEGLRWLVTELVSRGVDIEGVDEDAPVDLRIPPLLYHVSKGSFAVADILLDMGANVNLTVSHGRRAVVHECIRRGNVPFLQKLVGLHRQKKQEIDWERLSSYRVKLPGSFNPIEMTPLHMACSKGQHECLRLLLNEVNVSLEKEASRGLTALHFAAISGHTAIINELVGLGHSVTVFSDTGDTPLHLAANNGHLFAVKSLIDLGALDTVNASNSTARTLAARNGYIEIVEMLEEAWGSTYYDNVADKITARKTKTLLTGLRASIYSGNIRGCQRSDRGGCPLDRGLPLEDGYTPLILALCENQLHVATWLLDRGVSVFRRSYSASQAGFTSAIIVASGHTDFLQLLPTLLDHYVKQTPDWITDYWIAIWEAISKVNSPGLQVLFSFLKAQLDTSM